jgi:hypothetical protein
MTKVMIWYNVCLFINYLYIMTVLVMIWYHCAIVNCNPHPHPPPKPRGKGGDMWCVFPLLTLSYAWLGGGFSNYRSPTLVRGAFMWECTQPAKGLFIWEAGQEVCRDRTMNGIPACINFYYIYHQMFIWTQDVFRPVPGKRDPGLCNWDPASTGTFSSM